MNTKNMIQLAAAALLALIASACGGTSPASDVTAGSDSYTTLAAPDDVAGAPLADEADPVGGSVEPLDDATPASDRGLDPVSDQAADHDVVVSSVPASIDDGDGLAAGDQGTDPAADSVEVESSEASFSATGTGEDVGLVPVEADTEFLSTDHGLDGWIECVGDLDFGDMDLGEFDYDEFDLDEFDLGEFDLGELDVDEIVIGEIALGDLDLDDLDLGDFDLGELDVDTIDVFEDVQFDDSWECESTVDLESIDAILDEYQDVFSDEDLDAILADLVG